MDTAEMVEQMLRDMTDAHVYNCACLIYIYIWYIYDIYIWYIYDICIYVCVYMFHKKNKKLPYDHKLHLWNSTHTFFWKNSQLVGSTVFFTGFITLQEQFQLGFPTAHAILGCSWTHQVVKPWIYNLIFLLIHNFPLQLIISTCWRKLLYTHL